jgi:catechol 2,3-dioxygenase-like lactoylglutathione lyase family enzyme
VPDTINGKFNVGGVLLDQPFKIRRLGHFGINATKMEEALHFYHALLGFRIVDVRGPRDVKPEHEAFGDLNGYFFRYGHDHHAFVLYNHRYRGATDRMGRYRDHIPVNQITWQVGSLREVVDATDWFKARGCNVVRYGRDMPGSNWHTYLMDADWFQNELYYGIEQIGWDGRSKPWDMHNREFHESPDLPQISEYREVDDAEAAGVDLLSGFRNTEPLPETYDVDGILLARPFKIVKHGPVRLFCEDMDAALAFYRDTLGFIETETTQYQGHTCHFLRNNTEHHAMALYPVAVRDAIGARGDSLLFGFGVQVANYRQLRDAVVFLKGHGVKFRTLPPELFPGMDHTAFALDPDGNVIQLYYAMEQIGWDGRPRPPEARRVMADPDPGNWPETLEPMSDTYMGEPFLGPWG